MTTIIIIAVIVLVIIGAVIMAYNNLAKKRIECDEAFAAMDVYMKQRYDMIPNLVETVKGYAKHEKETFTAVINARNKFQEAKTPEEEMKASGEMTKALNKMMLLVEAYPELKANENFLQLQGDLKDCEEKIAYSRQFYNDSVLSYMNKIEMFPSNIIASMFGFKEMKYFEVEETEKKAPTVKF